MKERTLLTKETILLEIKNDLYYLIKETMKKYNVENKIRIKSNKDEINIKIQMKNKGFL